MIRNMNVDEMFVFLESRQNALSQSLFKRRRNSLVASSRLFTFSTTLDSNSIATLETQILINNDDDALLSTLEDNVRDAFERLRNENKIIFDEINDCVVIHIFLTTNNTRMRMKFFAL